MTLCRHTVAAALAAVGMLVTSTVAASAKAATSPLSAARYTAFDQGYVRDPSTKPRKTFRRACGPAPIAPSPAPPVAVI